MFEKRLFSLVPQATPYIMASVLFKWIALMANITVMWMLARILGGIVTNGLSAALAVDALAQAALPLAAAIIVRAASIYLAQRAGDKAAFEAVRRVRSLVYDKLTALGPSYTETVPTAEAVQTSVEGATQLQVYFGGYLPQLFFAGLAPITLFVLLVGQAGLPAALLLACVPVIPVSIMMVMRNAKRSVPSTGAAMSILAACSWRPCRVSPPLRSTRPIEAGTSASTPSPSVSAQRPCTCW